MNHIEKLFKKINKKDREILLKTLNLILARNLEELRAIKLSASDFYRVRKGNFRIIFHYEGAETIVDAVRLRDESTYKDF
jgi:mRNA-degrading endonuclease RelE of RelBE toxin-antitoxin system